MRRAAKIDLNQPEIVSALRSAGCSVQLLHSVGQGCPDLLVGVSGENVLMEVKSDTGGLTEPQIIWHRSWNGTVHIVRSVDDALAIVNEVRKRLTNQKLS
jgi:hypothetical protein